MVISLIRRKTGKVQIGNVRIGSGYPVAIQSMCSTKTENAVSTVSQILKLEKEGCEIIRVAVPNFDAVDNLPAIQKKIHIPLIADIHFDYRLALAAIGKGVSKIRINPGNIGGEERVSQILKEAKKAQIALRLGVNSGSLEEKFLNKYGRPSPEALTESALYWIKFFENHDFCNFVVSVKSSDVTDTVKAYQLLAEKCDYPFHLGITEAGLPPHGNIKSAIGIGALLLQGIGDTIRVSLTAQPIEEIKTAKQILKSLNLYGKEPQIVACPACGRTEINLIKIAGEIEKRLSELAKPVKVSVMGCAVNGLGEAREADWGICGGRKQCAIFRKGRILKWVPETKIVSEFMKMIKTAV